MDANELRLECLRLAQQRRAMTTDDLIDAARRMSDFVMGRQDSTVIHATQEFVRAVTGKCGAP